MLAMIWIRCLLIRLPLWIRGDVACQFVLHHFTLDSSISILVTPEEASPFCFGSDVIGRYRFAFASGFGIVLEFRLVGFECKRGRSSGFRGQHCIPMVSHGVSFIESIGIDRWSAMPNG